MNPHETGQAQGFWALLTDDDRAALTDLGRITVFSPGATMCVEGDTATHMFILVAGWVKIFSTTSDGHEMVLALRGQGDIVGEIAGETTGYRTATVQAIGTVHALIVAYRRFSEFLDAHAEAKRVYRRVLTRRWNDAGEAQHALSVTNGAQRLARLLLDLADQQGNRTDGGVRIALPLSQEELASLIGTSRATVTHALSNLRHRGIVRAGQREITITDPAALKKIAGPGTHSGL